MTFVKNWSLRTKIIGLVFTCMVLLGAGAWLSFGKMYDSYQESLTDVFKSKAMSLVSSIATQFSERYGDVQAFAMNDTIQSMNGKQMQADLNDYISLYGDYDLIVVVDKNGHFVASNDKDVAGKPVNKSELEKLDYTQAEWFKAAIAGKFTEDKSKGLSGTYFEDWVWDSMVKVGLGEDRMGSSFSTVIKNHRGEVVGVISNRAASRWVEDEFKDVYLEMKEAGYPDVEMTLLNNEGLYAIQYHPGDAKGASLEVEHDLAVNLKKKYFTEENEISKALEKKNVGYGFEIDPVNGEKDVVGYSYVTHPKWIDSTGWSVLVHDAEREAMAAGFAARNEFFFMMGIIFFIAAAVSVFVSIVLSKSVETVTHDLEKNSSEVASAAERIATGATQLSEASTEQAAALQETVAAIDEITAMVGKNSEAAQQSQSVSEASRGAAEKGRGIVENMIRAIGDIESNNQEISNQMTESNRQLSEITKLINDIGTKTKVINEIVFQTKLLSFNASVEAARAGEYGKGFAVVAEEVGNLAQMSGNAAKEISGLLDKSVQQVDAIVQSTKGRVERLMETSSEKVRIGSDTAKECSSALNEILENVQRVDSLVSEIAVASKEQSTGIQEISKAVGQMEQVVQQNTGLAQESSTSAEQLREQSISLNVVVGDLVSFVSGSGKVGERKIGNSNTAKVLKFKKSSGKGQSQDHNSSASKPRKMAMGKSAATTRSQASEASMEAPVQKVAGGDFVPSNNDPGFEE
ncbi:MAG: hypothetical protein COT73_10495 [Bdellovibrio sp. CG10_big_fil_rev_8_21_14_0_10_47_8]|nr:MAG: hypothetical protein COT73_10495 [Bdellovibrio sp. CG10_big_fil_rev_8_21_14_0_10_47_8]